MEKCERCVYKENSCMDSSCRECSRIWSADDKKKELRDNRLTWEMFDSIMNHENITCQFCGGLSVFIMQNDVAMYKCERKCDAMEKLSHTIFYERFPVNEYMKFLVNNRKDYGDPELNVHGMF